MHNYDFSSTMNLIETTLQTENNWECKCDCHTLWGSQKEHISQCCQLMFDDDEK